MRGFGELESRVMQRLWDAPEGSTVREVRDALAGEHPVAYTTVMTVLDTLHRKGWLQRELDGRAYRYTPATSREQYTADLMGEALQASSDRSATLVAFLDGLDPGDAARLRAALDRSARPGRRG